MKQLYAYCIGWILACVFFFTATIVSCFYEQIGWVFVCGLFTVWAGTCSAVGISCIATAKKIQKQKKSQS